MFPLQGVSGFLSSMIEEIKIQQKNMSCVYHEASKILSYFHIIKSGLI